MSCREGPGIMPGVSLTSEIVLEPRGAQDALDVGIARVCSLSAVGGDVAQSLRDGLASVHHRPADRPAGGARRQLFRRQPLEVPAGYARFFGTSDGVASATALSHV
jgi:hypothetical protein